MQLSFLGRENGFGVSHTSAYFVTDNNELVIIDCSISAFQKLKHFKIKDYKTIYVLITHTHSDHISGLSLLVQYSFFNHHKEITIIAPSMAVKNDISVLLEIEGCSISWYKLYNVDEIQKAWINKSILTEHTPQLNGKCFGYSFNIQGEKILYTGDTNTLEPFRKEILTSDEVYIDVSISNSPVHLSLIESLEDFLFYISSCNVRIYIMHLDNEELAEDIVSAIDGIDLVTVV